MYLVIAFVFDRLGLWCCKVSHWAWVRSDHAPMPEAKRAQASLERLRRANERYNTAVREQWRKR